MDREATERDLEIRAAIDEYHEAGAEYHRVHEETKLWQQENPQPTQPRIVESTAEIEEHEKATVEWSTLYDEQRERREEAEGNFQEAAHKQKTLLPRKFGYRYRRRTYSLSGSAEVLITEE